MQASRRSVALATDSATVGSLNGGAQATLQGHFALTQIATRARLLVMLRGAIVAESLRLGVVVEGMPLVMRKLERIDAGLDEQPPHWTLLWFEADEADGDRLAESLADALEPNGGWYADFHSDTEVTVVFAGRVFRYRRGDGGERAKVADYARSVGVPEEQLDWAE